MPQIAIYIWLYLLFHLKIKFVEEKKSEMVKCNIVTK